MKKAAERLSFLRPQGVGILSQRGSAASLFPTGDGIGSAAGAASFYPHTVGGVDKGGVSLFKKRYPSLTPSQRKFHIASEQLEELQCLPIALPARGEAALALLYDLPLLLSSAAALPTL